MSFRKKTIISLVIIVALVVTFFPYENNIKSSENTNPIKSILLSKNSVNLTSGMKTVISAKISYTNDNEELEKHIWTSDDKNIATITNDGIITGISNGTTYILCSSKSGDVVVRCKVVVRHPYNKVSSISFPQKEFRLNIEDKRKLEPSIKVTGNKTYTTEPIEWSSSNNKVAKVSSKGVVKGQSNGTAYITIKSKFSGKKATCKLVVTPTKYIAYTFDDGPGQYTKKLVDALKKYDSKATFFALGRSVEKYRDALKYAHANGMEIGTHTYAHKNLKKSSKSTIKSEIKKGKDAIKDTIGVYPTLLRPPYGNYNKTVSKNAGVPMIYWSVDTLDWKHKKTKYVTKSILRQSKGWDIVLLHDIHKTSVNGFIKALPKLKKDNYELVTVSELYQIYGKKLKPGVMYYGPMRKKK
ncbi:MAG: polysaccharide deacetylase family protein [Eubacterium sp.]|nr:polysaccharide deacetylase family protein [Eubacterium sp.]